MLNTDNPASKTHKDHKAEVQGQSTNLSTLMQMLTTKITLKSLADNWHYLKITIIEKTWHWFEALFLIRKSDKNSKNKGKDMKMYRSL